MSLVYFIRIFFVDMFYPVVCSLLDLLNAKSVQFNSGLKDSKLHRMGVRSFVPYV